LLSCLLFRTLTLFNYDDHQGSIAVTDGRQYQQAVLEAATICLHPMQLDLRLWKVVSEIRVTWPTSVPILVFFGLSVLDLDPMYATDRCHRHKSHQTRIMA